MIRRFRHNGAWERDLACDGCGAVTARYRVMDAYRLRRHMRQQALWRRREGMDLCSFCARRYREDREHRILAVPVGIRAAVVDRAAGWQAVAHTLEDESRQFSIEVAGPVRPDHRSEAEKDVARCREAALAAVRALGAYRPLEGR